MSARSDSGPGWAIGAARESVAALHAALEVGPDFIDTADVYGDGCSEPLGARVLNESSGERPLVVSQR